MTKSMSEMNVFKNFYNLECLSCKGLEILKKKLQSFFLTF